MKKILMNLACISMFMFSAFATDTTYYCTQSGAGARDGKNFDNAWAVADFNMDGNWASIDSEDKIDPGDTVILSGIISSTLMIQGSGKLDKKITIKYADGAKSSAAAWGDSSSSAIYGSSKDYIIIDGGKSGIIECTDNGTRLGIKQNSSGVFLINCDNWEIKNLIIKNIYERTADSDDSNRFGRGVNANTCSSLLIHDCVFSQAEYALYITAAYANTHGLRIYDCDFSRIATAMVVALSAAVDYSDLEIYNNKIYDLYYWDGEWAGGTLWNHCDGIHTWGNYPGNTIGTLKIYGNEFSGDWGKHTTAWIYCTDYTTPVEVYNNLFVNSAEKPAHAFVECHSFDENASAKVYNNTFIGRGSTNTGGTGVMFRLVDPDIKNNIFKDLYIAFYTDSGFVDWISDNNNFSNVRVVGYDGSWKESLPDWQNFLGGCSDTDNDCMSIISDPSLNEEYKPDSLDDPVVNRGVNLSNMFTKDKDGRVRGTAWDIGAYEYPGGDVVIKPAAPTSLIIE